MLLNKLNLFKNSQVSQDQFVNEYWHKKPLLIRNAINAESMAVIPGKSQLKKLSSNHDIQSRLVFKNSETQYDVEYGPFESNDWDELDHDCWSLLVSDIDKWTPNSRNLLKHFDFLRNWIFDDIMVSCGSIGGTVGPHTDHYDVFLLQTQGKRQWSYSQNRILNPDLLPEQALKLMSQFKADEIHELNPGDILYLPPEVAHYGIATTDDCVTCSIGMRTPSHSELLTSFVDNIAQKLSDDKRFEEPAFNEHPNIGEFTLSDMTSISNLLSESLSSKNSNLNQWFGKYITEYRSLFFEFNHYQSIDMMNNKQNLLLSPFTKCCYFKEKNNAQLFVNGESFISSIILAEMICDVKIIKIDSLSNLSKSDNQIIKSLFENGSLIQKDSG